MALLRVILLLGACLVLVLAPGCETSNNDDEGGDVAVTDTPGDTPDTGGGYEGECTQFCTDQVGACPEDDTLISCVESCVQADKIPDATALACAAAAADCTATRACWPLLYN